MLICKENGTVVSWLFSFDKKGASFSSLFFLEAIRLLLFDKTTPYASYVTLGTEVVGSLTRLGDLLDFGQLFKAFGDNYFAKSFTFLGIFCKGVKIFNFFSEIIFGEQVTLVVLHKNSFSSLYTSYLLIGVLFFGPIVFSNSLDQLALFDPSFAAKQIIHHNFLTRLLLSIASPET